MNDTIYKQVAIEAIEITPFNDYRDYIRAKEAIENLPPAQPTLNGYNIEHLLLIAKLLEKENLPPERVSEALSDVGRVVAIVKKEYEEALRKAVERCMI